MSEPGADSPRPDSPRPDSSADANGSASSASVAAPVEAPAAPPPVGHRPRLHISSLPTRWGNEEASAYFTQFGTITDVIVFREPGTGRSRYGFIEFSTMESAQAAIAATDGAKVDDATMVVKFAAPKAGGGTYGQQSGSGKGATQDASRLYVGNIGKGATKDQVREEFEKFGRLTEVNIFQNQKAIQRRGGEESLAAFVQFELAADAKVAKETLHGKLNALRGEEEAMIERGDNFQQTPALIVDYAKPKPEFGNRGGNRGGYGGYDDRRGGSGGYGGGYGGRDNYRPSSNYYDDRRGGYDYRGYDRPAYDDRRGYGYDDRRGYGYDDRRGGYDDRRGYDDRGRSPQRDDRRDRSRSPRRDYGDRTQQRR